MKIKEGEEAVISAIVFDVPELTLATVIVRKVKRKYAIVEYHGELYEVPKWWLRKKEEWSHIKTF
ncbi:MAG: hypothetical protein DRP27_05315 [Thermotogae bacterium]|nr:MAG: hypothetical protein DRP27_05315 [Thermotogota bacterium]